MYGLFKQLKANIRLLQSKTLKILAIYFNQLNQKYNFRLLTGKKNYSQLTLFST